MMISLLLTSLSVAPPAQDGPVFSISWRGRSNGVGGRNCGDLLAAAPPGPSTNAPPANVFLAGTALGIQGAPGCTSAPGRECGRDLDAVTHGSDAFLGAWATDFGRILFSVDSHGTGEYQHPGLDTIDDEASFDDQGADVARATWPGHPLGIDLSVAGAHAIYWDGDGDPLQGGAGMTQGGLGLIEPNALTHRWPFRVSDAGDDLDALDDRVPPIGTSRVFFSLAGELLDPFDPAWAIRGPGAAQTQGVSAADVLMVRPFVAAPTVYASALQLGLDRNRDDIDALSIAEDGVPGYTAPQAPFAWGPGAGDMLLFSLRRGSDSIGRLDSALGLRIVEGDVLTPPRAPGLAPAIAVPAEALGITVDRGANPPTSTDLDALDIDVDDFRDCNGNGEDDRIDVSSGVSYDLDDDGIPDECEYVGDFFCGCASAAHSPCGNSTEDGGCKNSTGFGAELNCLGALSTEGNFGFFAQGLPPASFAVMFSGSEELVGTPPALGDGVLCMGGTITRVTDFLMSSSAGTIEVLPGVLATYSANGGGMVTSGMTLSLQMYYRDVLGPCGSGFNLTNGVRIVLE